MGSSGAGSWVGVGVGLHMWACCSKAVFQRSFELPVVRMPFSEKRTLYLHEPWFTNTFMFNFEEFFQICRVSVLHSVVKRDLLASRKARSGGLDSVVCAVVLLSMLPRQSILQQGTFQTWRPLRPTSLRGHSGWEVKGILSSEPCHSPEDINALL